MCVRVFSTQDLRDFFANEEHRNILVGKVLFELVEYPSQKLVDLLVEEYIDDQERTFGVNKFYDSMECMWAFMEMCRLDYRFDDFLCKRYGKDRVVYGQDELDELLEAENERADVHP